MQETNHNILDIGFLLVIEDIFYKITTINEYLNYSIGKIILYF